MLTSNFAIECTHKYSMHFRIDLSIKRIAIMELFLNRSVKNLNLAAWCVMQNLPVLEAAKLRFLTDQVFILLKRKLWVKKTALFTCKSFSMDIASGAMKAPGFIIITIFVIGLSLMNSCAHKEPPVESSMTPEVQPAVQPVIMTTSGLILINETQAKGYVEDLIVSKGLDRAYAHALMSDPRMVFDEKFVLKNLNFARPKASAKSPGRMEFDKKYVIKGRAFIAENQDLFDEVQEKYEISPEIIMAILIVETRIGTYPMKYHAFNVYANISLISDPAIMARLKDFTGVDNIPLHDEEGVKKTLARGRWAAGELYNLILLADALDLDPQEIMGSVGGALGPAQFIPSTFMKWGADGDDDGVRNPFNMQDAIASIANLLKKSGWRENGDEKKNRAAIWLYNHSDVYVNTIMKLYEDLSKT
jgi:membrane-bound lytic murein transglycosylase B